MVGENGTARRRRGARSALAILLAAAGLFLLANLGAALVLSRRASGSLGSLAARYGLDRVARAYPGMPREELKAFLHENTASRVLEYEPFTECRVRPVRGPHVNVVREGFRLVRDQGPWPPDPRAPVVFVFGGSTTFGDGLPDEGTLPSHLQEALAPERARVYNFGRPGHFSSPERILFAQLAVSGYRPDLAVFVDGLNEWYYLEDAAGPYLWTGPKTEVLRALSDEATDRPLGHHLLAAVRALPLVRWLVPPQGPPRRLPRGGEGLEAAIARWERNRRALSALARGLGIPLLVVRQPVPGFSYDTHAHLFPEELNEAALRSGRGYARMAETGADRALGDDVLDLARAAEGKKENLFVDSVHYTSAFADELARRIADEIRARGLLRAR